VTGSRVAGGGFIEHFRRDAEGRVADTQYQLASGDGYYYGGQWGGDQGFYGGGYRAGPGGQWIGRSYYPNWQSPPQAAPPARGFFQPWRWTDNPASLRDFFWGGRLN
jgi:hypothetical protein